MGGTAWVTLNMSLGHFQLSTVPPDTVITTLGAATTPRAMGLFFHMGTGQFEHLQKKLEFLPFSPEVLGGLLRCPDLCSDIWPHWAVPGATPKGGAAGSAV